MGLRMRKSIKLSKGVKVNLGKKGASVTVGTKGLHHTVHSSGRRTTSAGIPGTGISYVKTSSGKTKTSKTVSSSEIISKNEGNIANKEKKKGGCGGCLIAILVVSLIVIGIFIALVSSGGDDNTPKKSSTEATEAKPVSVESIAIEGYDEKLVIGEKTKGEVTITPEDAEDKTITWNSSDESVAIVDEHGEVNAIGGGKTTITATSANGIASSYDVSVNGEKALMSLYVRYHCENDVNIGDEWTYDIQLNGERVKNEVKLEAGDELDCYAEFTESDDNPDVGSESTSHTVTKEELKNGFDVSMDLYVTENGGRYSGESAHFVVTYLFRPMNAND